MNNKINSLIVDGQTIAVDPDGYLQNLDDWCEPVATALAAAEGITLTSAHWEVLHILRDFYQAHETVPASRALVNLVKRDLGPDKGRSIHLMNLFGGNPAQQASKLAGLPKPENCP